MTEKPSATLAGTVEKTTALPSEPEIAQILIEGADPSYREIRIENKLIDDDGEEVHLKPGAKVHVKVRSRAPR